MVMVLNENSKILVKFKITTDFISHVCLKCCTSLLIKVMVKFKKGGILLFFFCFLNFLYLTNFNIFILCFALKFFSFHWWDFFFPFFDLGIFF